MMGYYYDGLWGLGGLFMGIFMIIFWVAIIWGVVALIRMAVCSNGKCKMRHPYSEDASMKILRERYARGEIDKKEFEDKKKDLGDEWNA